MNKQVLTLTPEELQAQQRLREFMTELEYLQRRFPEVRFESDDPRCGVLALIQDGARCLAVDRVPDLCLR